MVAICPEVGAGAVTWGKSVDEAAEYGFGWVGNSTWFMRKGIEFIGKVDEAWVTSSVFGSDTRSVCCADCSGTVGAIV